MSRAAHIKCAKIRRGRNLSREKYLMDAGIILPRSHPLARRMQIAPMSEFEPTDEAKAAAIAFFGEA